MSVRCAKLPNGRHRVPHAERVLAPNDHRVVKRNRKNQRTELRVPDKTTSSYRCRLWPITALCFVSFCIGKELRRLPAIELAVVTHDANPPVAQHLEAKRLLGHPTAGRARLFPQNKQRKLSRIVDAFAHVVVYQTFARRIE